MKSNIGKFSVGSALWCMTLAALLAFASPVFAQTTGRLTGTVEDAQGGAPPGVPVTVTSPQLQGANTTVTDASGQFRFPSLPPGTYNVKAELPGFRPAEQNEVGIGIDQTINLGLKMQIAGVAETVHVLGASPVLDTTSSVGGIHVRPEMFDQL